MERSGAVLFGVSGHGEQDFAVRDDGFELGEFVGGFGEGQSHLAAVDDGAAEGRGDLETRVGAFEVAGVDRGVVVEPARCNYIEKSGPRS
jgi:hypothetical protein